MSSELCIDLQNSQISSVSVDARTSHDEVHVV